MSKQPEALRLADELDEFYKTDGIGGVDEAAAELRRLHALCEEMGEALKRLADSYTRMKPLGYPLSDSEKLAKAALAKWKESK